MVHSGYTQYAENLFAKDELLDRWLNLCDRLDVSKDVIHRVRLFDQVMHSYTHPARVYHTPGHIQYCMKKFDEVRHLVPSPDQLELAIWFHDIVHEPWHSDNEERSADMAQFYICTLMGSHSLFAAGVASIIIGGTKHLSSHLSKYPHNNMRFMSDIDLANMGDSWDVFHENLLRIMKENLWQGEVKCIASTILSLNSFWTEEHIFFTEYFREKYEAQARANIDRAIKELTT